MTSITSLTLNVHCIRNVIEFYGRGSEVYFEQDETLWLLSGLTEVITDTELRCDF